MRAIAVTPDEAVKIPGPDALTLVEAPDPVAGPGEVVVAVAAAGLNRADLLQRMGFYPPPPGASDVIGLECSGTVIEVGEGVTRWKVGDEVCALLSGGAYATRVAIPEGQCLPVPAGLSLVDAAALPEVAATVWSNLFMIARLQPGETVLVHGGAGGIGSFALQLLRARGIRTIATASAGKLEYLRGWGAEAIDYTGDWVAQVKELGGADVILDVMGAAYLEKNLAALRDGGRIVVIGLQGGVRGEIDLNALMRKRASLIGTTLRSRPIDGKAAICREVEAEVWPHVERGEITVPIDSTYALEDASQAHRRMESGGHVGKLVLKVTV